MSNKDASMNNFSVKNRLDGRGLTQLRPLSIEYDVLGYASASVLFSQGNTKVLCSVTFQSSVPQFLRGQGTGWLSAEYAMLPTATQQRTNREGSQQQRNARSVEISRIIGRCLRTCVDLGAIGENSITIDCDVLQADGGTRVACITAASLALKVACARWASLGLTKTNVFKESIYAISVGILDGEVFLDLGYEEDSSATADFNFITTESGNILEIQGTAEKTAIAWSLFEKLKEIAFQGIKEIAHICAQTKPANPEVPVRNIVTPGQSKNIYQQKQKPSLFSLGNRIQSK